MWWAFPSALIRSADAAAESLSSFQKVVMAKFVEDRSGPINELRLKVVFPKNGDDYPSVSILIDGTDRLRYASRAGWMGFDPSEVFASRDVLLPGDVPRRVAVYQCSCGEPGCGSLAPVIGSDGESWVRWTDFQDFTAVFDGPVTLNNPEDEDPFSEGTPVAVEDLVFDRQQYEAEIDRAMADVSWESDGRKAARMLNGLVKEKETQRLEDAGVELVGVTFNWFLKKGPSWTMELRPVRPPQTRRRFQQILMTLKTGKASPEEQAQSLLEQLQSIPVEQWESTFHFRH
jgi:hypothetical protein